MITLFSCRFEGTLYNYLHTGNYLKKGPTYSHLKEVVVLNLKSSINLNELYKELCITEPPLALFLNDESEQILSVSDKWCH
jgi:hypothetical protein